MTNFEKLFSPVSIGNMELKNRLVMAPMATHFAGPDGAVTQRLIDYYAERARGGVSLIISESNYVQQRGRGGPNRLGLHDDALIEGHTRLAEAVHAEGAKLCAQLHHAGKSADRAAIEGAPISPSGAEGTREMTLDDIREVQRDFALAAVRARKAGFDSVQVHGAHGYLINQFLSPVSNKRTDEYGGDEEARMRFLLEVVEAIRREVGDDFPVLVRLSGEDHHEGGYGLDFILQVCRSLEEAGVTAIDLSGCTTAAPGKPSALPTKEDPPCPLVPYAVALKGVVDIPVGAVGRLYTPQMAEQVLKDGSADFILLGRSLLADAQWLLKAGEGREDEITHCIACNECLRKLIEEQTSIECVVNPELGNE
jgi:2,4-dienoyl-CoA reductase-like NADH-dependent reductase (Old Yellow Enzyme family)